MLFYRQFSLDILFYVKCRGKRVNGNLTLAIKFRTSRNKTFSELYRYLFVSFGFIESWVVPIRSRKEMRLELLWIFNWAAITTPAYLRLSSLQLRVNLYMSTIYRKMVKGWYGIASHQGMSCGSSTYQCVGDWVASLHSLCPFLYHFDVDFLIFREIGRLEKMELMNDEQHRGNVSIMKIITILKFDITFMYRTLLKYFHNIFFSRKLARRRTNKQSVKRRMLIYIIFVSYFWFFNHGEKRLEVFAINMVNSVILHA